MRPVGRKVEMEINGSKPKLIISSEVKFGFIYCKGVVTNVIMFYRKSVLPTLSPVFSPFHGIIAFSVNVWC